MSLQTWQETLITAQSDGTAVANTTTATTILPAQAKYTLPANFFDYVGKAIRIRASGRVSNTATTVTLGFQVKFGSTTVSASPTWSLVASAKTNVTWTLDLALHARVIGTSAALMAIGNLTSESAQATAVANQAATVTWPLSAPANGTAFDSTVAQVVDLLAVWGTASASNSIQLHQFALESMN